MGGVIQGCHPEGAVLGGRMWGPSWEVILGGPSWRVILGGHSVGPVGGPAWVISGRCPVKVEALRQASQEVGFPRATESSSGRRPCPDRMGGARALVPGSGCSGIGSAAGTGDVYEGARLGLHKFLDMLVCGCWARVCRV